MSEFIVHSVPGSPFGRSVLAMLEEKGAPYRLAPVAPGTSRSPAHLARHPFGRVPVLEHNGFSLYETQAILRYLDRVLPAPALTPADPKRAARMDQVMNINDWYLFHGVGNVIIFHRVIGPRLMGLASDEAAIAAAMPKARTVFGELARLLDQQPYFAGGSHVAGGPPGCAGRWLLHPDAGMGRPGRAALKSRRMAGTDGGAVKHEGHHVAASVRAGEGGVRERGKEIQGCAFAGCGDSAMP